MASRLMLIYALLVTFGCPQRISYLNGLFENDRCELSSGIYGVCLKIFNCNEEFENYRNNQSVLKVCNYGSINNNTIICCAKNQHDQEKEIIELVQQSKKSDLLEFNTCRDKFLKYRKKRSETTQIPLKTVDYGEFSNIAAIGWTQQDKLIVYKCGSSIITENAVVTAAHCKFFNRKQADVIRVGDRYLISEEDDENSQQLTIQMFITHPNYTSALRYNDIAIVKTIESMIFSKFVVPSCIANLDLQQTHDGVKWTVAGYGETITGKVSNILSEIEVEYVSNEDCNKSHQHDPNLTEGIHESQLCVRNVRNRMQSDRPGTCYGDSGNPLQYKSYYDEYDQILNQSNIYQIPTAIGIVSFGISCGFDTPTVYTKLYFFRDWMKNIIDEN